MDYIKIEFTGTTEVKNELIIASLIPYSFEGFEETSTTLCAYIAQDKFEEESVQQVAAQFDSQYSSSIVKQKNWNAEWESSFQPVCIGDFAGIRAEFHPPLTTVKYEIVITPKMSFGTGHHATTYMMIEQMQDIDFKEKKVFDFGTGTGVLAILSKFLGAATVHATDYDEWSIENSIENISRNVAGGITTELSEKVAQGKFDIILANINKNVIIENLSLLASGLSAHGVLLLSGLLIHDESDIVNGGKEYGLHLQKKLVRNNWISLKFGN